MAKSGKKSGNKDYKVGKNKPPIEHRFTSKNQPSPETKSKAVKQHWERKKMALALMDKQHEFLQMTEEQIEAIDTAKLSMHDLMILNFVKEMRNDPNLIRYHIDKHVPTPSSSELDITSKGKRITFGIADMFNDNPKA